MAEHGPIDDHELNELRTRIAAQGERRHSALREADEALEAMRDDLIAALEAGVPLAELARLAALGRPTLYRLRRAHISPV